MLILHRLAGIPVIGYLFSGLVALILGAISAVTGRRHRKSQTTLADQQAALASRQTELASITILQTLLDNLDKRVTILEQENAEQRERIDSLEQAIRRLRAQRDHLRQQVRELTTRLDAWATWARGLPPEIAQNAPTAPPPDIVPFNDDDDGVLS